MAARPQLVTALQEALAVYDVPTGEHSRRVGRLARAVGVVFGLREVELESLACAGTLHDLGKLGVTERTLAKPGPLDPEEWQEIRRHPQIGAELVRSCSPSFGAAYCAALEHVATGIETHHERVDGSGYPSGCAGEEIPLIGRILAPVDVFDSMTQDRGYRPRTFTVKEALAHLLEEAGRLFDPDVVGAVLEVVGRPA